MTSKKSEAVNYSEGGGASGVLDISRADDILNAIGYGPLQVLAFTLAGLTAIAFGMELVLFGILDMPIQEQWNLTSVQYAILPSVTGVGSIIGGFVYSFICDNYGRVWPYFLIMMHMGVGGVASAFSPNFPCLIVLRTFVSVAGTGVSTVMFSTLVEFLPPKNRAKILVCVLILQSLGICLLFGLGWWLLPTYPLYGWRYLVLATTVTYFLTAFYRLGFSIQSPRFLIAKGRHKEAKEVFMKMARLNGKNLEIGDCCNINSSSEKEPLVKLDRKPSRRMLSELLAIFRPPYLRSTLCLSIVFVTENAALSLVIYLPQVLAGFGLNPYFTSLVGYAGQIPGIILLSIIVEWPGVGRLNSLRFFTLMSIAAFLLFAFVPNEAAISVAVILVYFSMVPVVSLLYTYISELYSTSVRTTSIAYFVNLAAVFSFGTPYLSGWLAGLKSRWIFPTTWAGVFVVQFLVSLILNVETLNRDLPDTSQENKK